MGRPKDPLADMKKAAMAEMYKAGSSQVEIAEKFGISHQRVSQCIKDLGLNRSARGPWENPARNTERRELAFEMLRSGMTGREVAKHFGVSARMITKYIAELSEGAHESLRSGAEKAQFVTKAGVDLIEFDSFDQAKHAFWAFRIQRYRAADREIGWEITFREWWRIWKESGHWSKRGVSTGNYVMGRFGDVGPYKIGNVHIITHAQNTADSWAYLGRTKVGAMAS